MANRKQRRKMKQKQEDNYTQSIKSVVITLLVVLGVFLLFYLITVLINNNERRLNTKEPEKQEVTIDYNEILGDNTFTMSPTEYYVMFYDFEGPEAVYYDYLFDQYSSGKDKFIYKVDLSKKFNKKFIAEDKTNKKAKKAGDLKVKDATLIKIKKGKNVKYVEGSSQIIADALLK